MGEKEDKMHALLLENYPDASYYLNFSNPLELVVAAVISPQTRDEVVNAATPGLFARYKTAQDYAQADAEEVIAIIKKVFSCAKKAKNIIEICRTLQEKYQGQVPNDVEELVKLPGIGRKTANAIVINAFDNIVGVVVDSHVIRVAPRMGFSSFNKPDKIEADLMALFPKEHWKKLTWIIKKHGRAVCKPKPLCSECFLKELCPKAGVEVKK